MIELSNSNKIPDNDLYKIQTTLVNQINSMNEAELRIVSRSEKDLRDFIADFFKAVAKALGYIIDVVDDYEIEYVIKVIHGGYFNGKLDYDYHDHYPKKKLSILRKFFNSFK